MGKMKELLPDEDLHDYDFYDGVVDYEEDYYGDYEDDYNSGYSASTQAFNDRLDYARERYEAGEIDAIQLAEIRMGA